MSVFACSDFHGMLHFYKSIKEKLEPGDKVFYLGDAGDRGPHCWETIKAVIDDPQFIYLKGNHEDMLIRVLGKYLKMGCPNYYDLSLLGCNGGTPTYEEAIADPKLKYYYEKLVHLPLLKEYINQQGKRIVLSHAGFTPWKQSHDFEYRVPQDKDLLWNRDHFLDEWDQEECVDCYIVHGHTPIPYLLDQIDPKGMISEITPGPLWYDNKRKCCIDCGAVFTGYGVLLNLDTLESEVFSCERN